MPRRTPPGPLEPLDDAVDAEWPDLEVEEAEAPDLDPFEDAVPDAIAPPELPEDADDADDDAPPLPPLDDPLADEPDDWETLARDPVPVHEAPGDRVVLPWSLRAEIPALAMEVPALLDPGRADSEWVVPIAPAQDRVPLRVRLGPIEVRVTVRVRAGEDTGLRLGRDALGDRILVRSTP